MLDFFTYAGAPGAYSLTNGGGGGISWESDGISISASYVSSNADNGRPEHSLTEVCTTDSGGDSTCSSLIVPGGGLGTDASAGTGTVQIAYTQEQWGVAGAYSYNSGDNGAGLYSGNATPGAWLLSTYGTSNSFALSSWWAPEETGFIPSISAGWGINHVSATDTPLLNADLTDSGVNADDVLDHATSQSWYVGLTWEDFLGDGNALGLAGGQPTFVTSIDWDNSSADDHVADGNYAFELWYKFQVTDNISVTPAVFYLSRPLGQLTEGLGTDNDETFNNFGGVLRTTFKF